MIPIRISFQWNTNGDRDWMVDDSRQHWTSRHGCLVHLYTLKPNGKRPRLVNLQNWKWSINARTSSRIQASTATNGPDSHDWYSCSVLTFESESDNVNDSCPCHATQYRIFWACSGIANESQLMIFQPSRFAVRLLETTHRCRLSEAGGFPAVPPVPVPRLLCSTWKIVLLGDCDVMWSLACGLTELLKFWRPSIFWQEQITRQANQANFFFATQGQRKISSVEVEWDTTLTGTSMYGWAAWIQPRCWGSADSTDKLMQASLLYINDLISICDQSCNLTEDNRTLWKAQWLWSVGQRMDVSYASTQDVNALPLMCLVWHWARA